MIMPDFRDFKHSNELYHYGLPRRSGRYPWGSGKRPYQSDIVVNINKAIIKDKAISKETNRTLASQMVAYQMKYKVDNDKEFEKSINRLSKLSTSINNEVKDVQTTMSEEIRKASKRQDLKKEIYDYIYRRSNGYKLLSEDFYLELKNAIRDTIDKPKYMPETYKKNLQISKDINQYYKNMADEINDLIGGDVGSMVIPKMKSGITYNDVLELVLKYRTEFSWNQRILEQREEAIEDILSVYTLEEYNEIKSQPN